MGMVLTFPMQNHFDGPCFKKPTLRTILSQAKISRDEFLDAYYKEWVAIANSDLSYGIVRMVQAYVEMHNPSVDWNTAKDIESSDEIIEEVLRSKNES